MKRRSTAVVSVENVGGILAFSLRSLLMPTKPLFQAEGFHLDDANPPLPVGDEA
jgi:hypothetical protein